MADMFINGARVHVTQHAYAGFQVGDKYGQYWKVSAYSTKAGDALHFETNNQSVIRAAVIAWQAENQERENYDGCPHCGL